MKEDVIIIVTDDEVIFRKEFIKFLETNKITDIFYLTKLHIEPCTIVRENERERKSIRVLNVNDLKSRMKTFHEDEKTMLIANGVSSSFCFDRIISILIPKDKLTQFSSKFRSCSYEFHLNESKKSRIKLMDLPYYHVPSKELEELFAYSYFSSYYEDISIKDFIKKNPNCKIEISKMNSEKNDVRIEQIPKKQHYNCLLCKKKFNDYLEHIRSESHLKQIEENSQTYKSIANTFKRIISNNKERENKLRIEKEKDDEIKALFDNEDLQKRTSELGNLFENKEKEDYKKGSVEFQIIKKARHNPFEGVNFLKKYFQVKTVIADKDKGNEFLNKCTWK